MAPRAVPAHPPLFSPHLGDKLVDWNLLAAAGGMDLVVGKDIIELGPSYGIDLEMWAPYAKRYVMLESAPDVLTHLKPMIQRFEDQGYTCLVTLLNTNLQHEWPVLDAAVDLVIDFGTVDNVLAGPQPYADAMRALRPGGVLLTTYANFDYFKERMSSCGDEQRFAPRELVDLLSVVADVFVRQAEDQPRAAMAARKR